MFEWIALIVAFVGSAIAAAWDLKTTEIPDQIPHAMMVFGVGFWLVQSVLQNNYWLVGNSLIFGLSFLGMGFILYFLGQWGGGDAKILSAIGFLLPVPISGFPVQTLFPFPITYVINVFLVGAVYMMVYAFVLALINKKILIEFWKEIKASTNLLLFGSSAVFITFFFFNWYLLNLFDTFSYRLLLTNSIFPFVALLFLFFIWKFARKVEEVGFKRKIPMSKLRVGDVPADWKVWEGINEKQLKKLKQSRKKYILIKEGVRFAPAFPLALIFTLLVGDSLVLLINIFL